MLSPSVDCLLARSSGEVSSSCGLSASDGASYAGAAPPSPCRDPAPVTLASALAAHAAGRRLSEAATAQRNALRSAVLRAAKGLWADCAVRVYGSFAYGLSCGTSPLDLVIEGCGNVQRVASLIKPLTAGRCQLRVLRLLHFTEEGEPAAMLRVDDGCGLIANITAYESRQPSLGRLAARALSRQLDECPAAATVAAFVCDLLATHGLHTAASGGLPTHAVVLMALHCCRRSAVAAADAGLLLVDFLQLFGCDFDAARDRVSAADAYPPPLSGTESRELPAGSLWVGDASDERINASSCCRRFPEIRAALSGALDALCAAANCGADGPELIAAVFDAAQLQASCSPQQPEAEGHAVDPPSPQAQPLPRARGTCVTFAAPAGSAAPRPASSAGTGGQARRGGGLLRSVAAAVHSACTRSLVAAW